MIHPLNIPKRELLTFFLFVIITSILQIIILAPHLQFGFSTDDVNLISKFIGLGPHPFLKFFSIGHNLGGPHIANPMYYNGILFTLFGFNYQAYQIAALVFKIFSVISLYLLIRIVFNNPLLAFVSGFIFSFHFGSVGSLEMVARTQDYLVITGFNFFLILFCLINTKRLNNLIWIFFASTLLFFSFFINPIRAYPLLPFVFLIQLYFILKVKNKAALFGIFRTDLGLLLPFIVLFLWDKANYTANAGPLGNFQTILQKISLGNFQFLLTPFTTIGGIFLVGEPLNFLTSTSWRLQSFLSFFLSGPLPTFGVITLLLSFFISKKPGKFTFYVLAWNLLVDLVIFYIIDYANRLPESIRMSYDPVTYAPPAILGVYLVILTIFILKEWLNKQDMLLGFYLLGMSFTMTFIFFTWIFQDYLNIPLGIHGYSTIPSLGISCALSALIVLIYSKLKAVKGFHYIAPAIFLIIIPYLNLSIGQTQLYFKRYLDNGVKATDQLSMRIQFWNLVKNPTTCNKLFFFSINDYPNGGFYANIMINVFDEWYQLYSPFHGKIYCPVGILINDYKILQSSLSKNNGKEGFLYHDIVGHKKFFSLDDFYAFKLQNRRITSIKSKVLDKIGPQ